MMIHLIYVSNAIQFFSDQELIDLLRISRENNAAKDISGLLLYHDGHFMQILEGPEEAVDALYEIIRRDSRHKDVQTLAREPITERIFGEWSMGFQNIDQLIHSEAGASQFLTTPLTIEEFSGKPRRALILLESFRKNLVR